MSVMTDLYHGLVGETNCADGSAVKKVQRFAVVYKGKRHFVNTTTADSAIAQVRTKLLAEAARNKSEPDEALATFESFWLASGAKPSLRY